MEGPPCALRAVNIHSAGMESIGIPLAPSRPTSRPSRALLKLDSQHSTPSQFQKFMPSGSLSPLGRFKKKLGEGHPGAAWKDKQTCTSTRASSGMVARHKCRDCSLSLSHCEGSPELHSWLQAKARNLEPPRRNNHKLYFKKLEKEL